uniref:Metal regulatory transcription factor 1 n=4 Tax=Rodentia TaxID=9989 RepID=A0A286XT31_CAVPO
MGEHSPDDNI